MVGKNRTGPFLRNSEQVGNGVSPWNELSSASTHGVSTILPFELRYIGVDDFPPAALQTSSANSLTTAVYTLHAM